MMRRTGVFTGAFAAITAAISLAGSVPALAQRDRDWRDDRRNDSRYDSRYDGRYDGRYDQRNDGRYDQRYDDRYDRGRTSMEAIRRMADRAEATSNEFRDLFERYERDRDAFYRDNGGYNRRDDRYGRDRRYEADRHRDERVLSELKPYVQRMDEGLERLNHQTDDYRRMRDARETMFEIMRNARVLDRAFDNGSIRGRGYGGRGNYGSLNSRWVRLRSDLNALASALGAQRI